MVITCPVCREAVHVSCGYIVRHGSKYHVCSGSGERYVESSCC